MAKVILADVILELTGECAIAAAIRREFAAALPSDGVPHLTFHLVSALPHWAPDEQVCLVGDLCATANVVEFTPDSSCSLRLAVDAQGNWHVWCKPLRTGGQVAPRLWQRWRSRTFLTADEALGVNIAFGPLVGLLHLRILALGGALIHGAAFALQGKGLLLAGWGGSGKTSLLGHIAAQEASLWEYLGDDLAMFDSQGKLALVPLAIHFKHYNLGGFRELTDRVMRGRTGLEKWHWQRRNHGKKILGGMKRVAPEALFSLPQASRPVHLALHLDRYAGEELITTRMRPEDFASAACAGTLNEYRSLLGVLLKVSALPSALGFSVLPSVIELWRETEKTILNCVLAIPVWRIQIPRNWSSRKVGAELATVARELMEI